MLNHITEPTRITSTTSTLNDLSNDDNVVCAGVISDSVSDQLPIFISLQNQLSENVKTFRTTPNTKVDYALLRCLLEQTDFHITYDDDIDTECQNFTGTLTNILTKSTKTVNTLRYSTPICHWMTPSILTTLKREKKARILFVSHCTSVWGSKKNLGHCEWCCWPKIKARSSCHKYSLIS